MFEELEGIDIYSAAGVAVVSLEKALKNGEISSDEVVMLNITGGGEKLFKKHFNYVNAQPDLIMSPEDDAAKVISAVRNLFE